MDGLNIVAGDLEFLAKSDEMLGDDIKKIDIGPPLEKDARDAIPGSSSEKHIPEVVSAIKKRHQDLADNYHDFSDRVKQTSLDYRQNEEAIADGYSPLSKQLGSAVAASDIPRATADQLRKRMG